MLAKKKEKKFFQPACPYRNLLVYQISKNLSLLDTTSIEKISIFPPCLLLLDPACLSEFQKKVSFLKMTQSGQHGYQRLQSTCFGHYYQTDLLRRFLIQSAAKKSGKVLNQTTFNQPFHEKMYHGGTNSKKLVAMGKTLSGNSLYRYSHGTYHEELL